MFQNKCKICKSNKTAEIEFCRFYLKWSYSTLIDFYENDIDNLNSYNLSNHYNNHADREQTKFWRNLRDEIGIYEPNFEESKDMIKQIRIDLRACG